MTGLDLWMKNPLMVGGTLIVFAILDDFLTRQNFSLQKEKYSEFFEGELFEANIFHQKVIHENKPSQKWWYAALGIYILLSMCLSILLSVHPSWSAEFGLGVGFFILFDTLLDHLKSFLKFHYVKHHPETLQGKIHMSKDYQFTILKQETFIDSLLLILIWVLADRVFFLGGAFGLILISITSIVWKSKTNFSVK